MSLEKILDQVDEEFREAIEDPETFNFRQRNPYKQAVDPEPISMETAVVDLENQNIKVRYGMQSTRENYTCVKRDPETEVALVESNATHDMRDTRVNSRIHYLIHGDTVYRLENNGYEEAELQKRPLEVADEYEKLYRKAMEIDNQEKSLQKTEEDQGPEPVPPPETDEMFPE